MLKRLSPSTRSLARARSGAQLFNASNVDDNGSALFNPFVSSGSLPVAFARTDQRRSTDYVAPLADTLSLSSPLAPLAVACSPRARERLTGCVCLHALSSFQRTDRRCARGAPQGCCERACSPGPNPVPFGAGGCVADRV